MKMIGLTDIMRAYLVIGEAVSLSGLVANRGYSKPTKSDPVARQILYAEGSGAEFRVDVSRFTEANKVIVHLRPNNAIVTATLEDYQSIFLLVELHLELEGIGVCV